MRYLLIAVLATFSFTSCISQVHDSAKIQDSIYYPEPIDWISDFEHLFTDSQTNILDSIITKHRLEKTNQIAIVTFQNPGMNVDTFATNLFNRWGIGTKEKNNGVLFLICPSIRKVVIRNGYGIEMTMTDEESHEILKKFVLPEFKKNDFFTGTLNGILAIIEQIK